MKVRLTHKFADLINGLDLSKAKAGETLDLTVDEAKMLMAEGWAEYVGGPPPRDKAHDAPRGKPRRGRSAKKR